MKIFLYIDGEKGALAEFNDYDVPLEEGNTVYLKRENKEDGIPYKIKSIEYRIKIWGDSADLEQYITIKRGCN